MLHPPVATCNDRVKVNYLRLSSIVAQWKWGPWLCWKLVNPSLSLPPLWLEKPLRRFQVGSEITCINQVSASLGSNPRMRRQKFCPTHLEVGLFSPHERVSVWTESSGLLGLQPHPWSETAEAPFPLGTDFSSPHSAACAFMPQKVEKA